MYTTASGKSISISKSPIASGGEGEVFDIVGQKKDVAKVYFPKNRTSDRHKKLSYMIHNPPLWGADPNFQRSVIIQCVTCQKSAALFS